MSVRITRIAGTYTDTEDGTPHSCPDTVDHTCDFYYYYYYYYLQE